MASPQTSTDLTHDQDQPQTPPTDKRDEEQPQTASPLVRIISCALVFVFAVGLGISVGFTQRTADFNPTYPLRPPINNRIITLATDLISIDATTGTMTLDWSFMNDTACNSPQNPGNLPCPGHNPNSTVDIYFDINILRQNDPGTIPSDNMPDKPIFRHNATAVYALDVRNALAAFRTPLALFANVRGQASLSTLQNYPFDKYTAQIFLFALDSETRELVGLQIGETHGVAVGFQAVAERTPIPGRIYSGVISEAITISRSRLLKAYVLVIIVAVWLLTLMFLFVMVCIMCGYGFDVSLLLVPVATLFAITQLRASMPGAPPGFGAIVDFVGILPCLALTSISASLTIAALVFSSPTKRRDPIWKGTKTFLSGIRRKKSGEEEKGTKEA